MVSIMESIDSSIDSIIKENDLSNEDDSNEVDIYLNEKFTEEQKKEYNDNPLIFWNAESTQSELYSLSKLAIFIHTMKESESPSECLFSLGNNVVNEKRTCLSNKKIGMLMFLISRWKLNDNNN